MSTTTRRRSAPRLTDAQLSEMMKLVRGADSVELKVSVPAEAHRATIQGLPLDPVEAQPRQVFFFDTPDLALNKAGLVVRARRRQGGVGDTVIKLRPVVPDTLPSELRKDPAFNVEVDALPGGFVCSASFKGRTTGDEIRDAVSGKKRLSKLFSKSQRAFFRDRAPEGFDLDALIALGPTFLLKGSFDARIGIDAKRTQTMVAEVWLYPDGSRILELSTKCLPKDALTVAAECRAYLAERGVPLTAVQETKTKTALQYYAAQLAAQTKATPKPTRSRARRAPAGAAKRPASTAKPASTAR